MEITQQLDLHPGDLIIREKKPGWIAIKILAMDTGPDGDATAHCLTYESVSDKPDITSLQKTKVKVWHAPIDAKNFATAWERIGNSQVTKEELIGFVEYLKHTDFSRYANFTEQDISTIIRQANEHYKHAHALCEQGKRTDAILEYSKAVDLFPLFFEAVDNRAFTYMELGLFEHALRDFEVSLYLNPDGMSAFFSKGECLLRLGKLTAAEEIFSEGIKRFPEHAASFQQFLHSAREMQR
ncbi:tetratricopeptide repeat protein [Undibacterium sp. Di27W]|uniref:tetratricopeptide repeat protein n=1 Tax=Undibacterium sp. Di27W TaxID=3413036 RepID=UPI003BF38B19